MPYHAEEYGPTLEDYWSSCEPLCHRCHAMVHARFRTPNRWKLYLTQIMRGEIDSTSYPTSSHYVSLLSKFRNRQDIGPVAMPTDCTGYLFRLSLTEYDGPVKVATLMVIDLNSGCRVEVPDWTLYGSRLENLPDEGRMVLRQRGIDAEAFLSGDVQLPFRNGKLEYKPLYFT